MFRLSFLPLRFYLSPLEPITLSGFVGSLLRGGFGAALKQATCLQRKVENCAGCILATRCPYVHLFETPRLERPSRWDASHDPHPFIIEPPLDGKHTYFPNETLSFDFILLGRGIDYLPYIIYSFERLGEKGIGKERRRFRIDRVESRSGPNLIVTNTIYEGDSRKFALGGYGSNLDDIVAEMDSLPHSKLSLRFITPTRIKRKGRLIRSVDFETLLRSLLRRLSWLSELYCGEKWDLDYAALLGRARDSVKTSSSHLRWYDWERYSSRQNTRLKMGGFVGNITFEGELAEFLPFIKMGEYLHIGQGTAFGLGKYVMEPANKR